MLLRVITILVPLLASVALHAAAYVTAVRLSEPSVEFETEDNTSFELGEGNDEFVVDQAIALEGAGIGADEITQEAVEAMPALVKEIEPLQQMTELEDIPQVIGSELGPTQDDIRIEDPLEPVKEEQQEEQEKTEKPPEEKLEEIKPEKANALVDSPPIEALAALDQAGEVLRGGRDVSAIRKYGGDLFRHFKKKSQRRRGKRLRGSVKLQVEIDPPTGKIIEIKVIESSGKTRIDKAAIKLVERAAPFPPGPETLGDEPLRYNLPVVFSNKRRR